jgi:hypothetical protein
MQNDDDSDLGDFIDDRDGTLPIISYQLTGEAWVALSRKQTAERHRWRRRLGMPRGVAIPPKVREACGAGRVRINGICVARTTRRHVRRAARRDIRHHTSSPSRTPAGY